MVCGLRLSPPKKGLSHDDSKMPMSLLDRLNDDSWVRLDLLLDIWRELEVRLVLNPDHSPYEAEDLTFPLIPSAVSSEEPNEQALSRYGEIRWNAVRELATSGAVETYKLIKAHDPRKDRFSLRVVPVKIKSVLEKTESKLVPAFSRQASKHKIFIGHGHSTMWKDLKDFLAERLGLEWIEFNRDCSAGLATKERLEEMLNDVGFAFLVMTGEEERPGGTVHARDNIIHEAGLFQGKLGFNRAILLVEEGCSGFSNIAGLTYISFPRGKIGASSEEIRRVLEREGFLPAAASRHR